MKALTRAEEDIMQVLWRLEKAFVKDLLEELPEPKPAYTTVSTIVRILETKGFVGHESFGRSHRYHPLVGKEDYSKREMGRMVKDHFDGSPSRMLHFFLKNEDIDLKDLDKMLEQLKKERS